MASKRASSTKFQPPSIAPWRPKSKVRVSRIRQWRAAKREAAGAFILAAWLLTGCAGRPILTPPSPATPMHSSLPAAHHAAPDEALAALIAVERQASIDHDLATLAQLWSPDGRIVDGRNTAASDDDYVWAGRAAIMDRYLLAVFPNPPPPLSDPDALLGLSVQKEGDDVAAGTNGGDRWRLVYADDRWWLQELVYQQP